MIDRRKIEAEMLGHVYSRLLLEHGQADALSIIKDALEDAAEGSGGAFAASADKPDFAHFCTVLDMWRGTGALTIEDVEQTDTTLSFKVTRCEYVEAYRDLHLPEELVSMLSCCRDEPFCKGYDPCVKMERPTTIGNGDAHCDFRFTWDESKS